MPEVRIRIVENPPNEYKDLLRIMAKTKDLLSKTNYFASLRTENGAFWLLREWGEFWIPTVPVDGLPRTTMIGCVGL